ncbi:MAG: membrane protein insertion efficiency factor YidD [Hyphomicrobiaceae bacterium]|nr:membrane protein insertion efficiency factor YidD [Hyphomicrobiaceae bacterium]
MKGLAGRLAMGLVKLPIHAYRLTLKPYVGWNCRHLPTCSDYALEAIDRNGAWRGLWLMTSRISRCRPWGTAGYDPVPDLSGQSHRFAPWRYGRWSGAHMAEQWRGQRDAEPAHCKACHAAPGSATAASQAKSSRADE